MVVRTPLVFQGRSSQCFPLGKNLQYLVLDHYRLKNGWSVGDEVGVPAYLKEHLVRHPPDTFCCASTADCPARTNTVFARRSFSYAAPVTWNNLPADVMLCNSESSFKHLKTFLFNTCFYAAWLTPLQRLWSLRVMALYKYVYDYDYDVHGVNRTWQDHTACDRNGHMMTHSTKKPFECKFIGCAKSYCDARSLRRHLENHHQDFMTAAAALDAASSLDGCSHDSAAAANDRSIHSFSADARFHPNSVWTTGYNPLEYVHICCINIQ